MDQERRKTEDTESEEDEEYLEEVVDEWGEESFPASDPPGERPPSADPDDED